MGPLFTSQLNSSIFPFLLDGVGTKTSGSKGQKTRGLAPPRRKENTPKKRERARCKRGPYCHRGGRGEKIQFLRITFLSLFEFPSFAHALTFPSLRQTELETTDPMRDGKEEGEFGLSLVLQHTLTDPFSLRLRGREEGKGKIEGLKLESTKNARGKIGNLLSLPLLHDPCSLEIRREREIRRISSTFPFPFQERIKFSKAIFGPSLSRSRLS